MCEGLRAASECDWRDDEAAKSLLTRCGSWASAGFGEMRGEETAVAVPEPGGDRGKV